MLSILGASNEKEGPSPSLEELRERLARVRRKRSQLARVRQACQEKHNNTVVPRLNHLQLQRQIAVETYQSVVVRRQALAQYLDLAARWNVLNDCFHIWHQGPWATINGARLGGEAPRLPVGLLHPEPAMNSNGGSYQHQAVPQHVTSTRRYLLWSSVAPAPMENGAASSVGGSDPSSTSTIAAAAANAIPAAAATTTDPPKVPWAEINAALGHVVLLLHLLKDKSGWTLTHDLIPMASTSQIGIRRKAPKSLFGASSETWLPPVIHNLYFDDASFSLFGKGGALRQFNIGLSALLECFVQISRQLSDKTIALPHSIHIAGEDAAAGTIATTIGGVAMAYNDATAVDFTRACKYLLTNLKWLVAYVAKHHVER